ncbi:Vacuolar-sorting protein SNF8 [Halotydeus destructor]|nr:Vacuolar-sorting protein SNF8 [Halotydeus destructor]
MRRRGLGGGLGAIQKQQEREALFREKSSQLAEGQIQKLTEQMTVFKANLEEFARKHKKEIRKNATFRREFQEMCSAVGVDPLQSSSNFWTKVLGVGDYYYELAVQIVEVCMSTSHRNGGIMNINELLTRVRASRQRIKSDSKDVEVSTDDLLRAIDKLNKLGGGLRAIPSGKTFIVQAVAAELSMDNVTIIQKAQENGGHVDKDFLVNSVGWSEERALKALQDMVMEGLVWLDEQSATGSAWYWFPGLV